MNYLTVRGLALINHRMPSSHGANQPLVISVCSPHPRWVCCCCCSPGSSCLRRRTRNCSVNMSARPAPSAGASGCDFC